MEEEVIKVRAKCKGCGARHTIAMFAGECAAHIIVGCDLCNKTKHTEREEEEDDEGC